MFFFAACKLPLMFKSNTRNYNINGPPANIESGPHPDDTKKGASDLVTLEAWIFLGAGSDASSYCDFGYRSIVSEDGMDVNFVVSRDLLGRNRA